ncbi:DUF305 domain-containing protein [Streptomyces nanhaiensis]|uniref:DUF305 domain-containing protein n=1 Tax=Streptomyces nanhaiensis TaxID=679319 RepID=UPI00399C88F6
MTDSTISPRRRGRHWTVVAVGALAVVLAAPALIVTTGGGGQDSTPADDSADAGFARDMAVHHQQAVEMSFIVRDRTDDEDVRLLAYDIANTQANQRGMLLGWLDLWNLSKISGNASMAWMESDHSAHEARDGAFMPGTATEAQLDELREAGGKEAEVLYLQLMTEHHQGGVRMAHGCVQQCEVPKAQKLAQGMVDAQESEMNLMADMLAERGAAPKR